MQPFAKSSQKLPTELILNVFSYLPMETLAEQRLISQLWNQIAKSQLNQEFKRKISTLHLEYKHAHTKYQDRQQVMTPHLEHYKAFLNGIAAHDVTEATWYTNPPQELQIVCECLCLLKEANDSEYITEQIRVTKDHQGEEREAVSVTYKPSEKRMSWSTIKKIMSKYDFRQWVLNLNTNVEKIPIQNAKKVEMIIVQDSTITYERLREVSLAGYKLLIYVAACLQHVSISHDLDQFYHVQNDLNKKLKRTKQYLQYLN